MKTVLITGGSRGIGRAMVELFAKKGYAVAFTYRSSHDLATELSAQTGALAICADSTSYDDVKKAVDITREKLGNIEILINNSAVSDFSLFTDMTLDAWRAVFSENVDGAFMYTREVLPDMINAKSGRIINISSMWGIVGASCEVAYSASKAALIGMTKALAKELGPSGITVNCIAPGIINTEMNARLSCEELAALCEDTPVMRLGSPDEVAEAALFLASDAASFITGDVMNVSGGYIT